MLGYPDLAARPRRRPGLVAFPVADELVLLPPDGERAYALNESGVAIWNLCDGRRTLMEMLGELRLRYQGEDISVLADLAEALLSFQSLGLLEAAPGAVSDHMGLSRAVLVPAVGHRPPVRFVCGIEDRPYFHWQLAILFESLSGQLAGGWDISVVVCNDHARLSAGLQRLLDVYGVHGITAPNHAHSHDIDFSAGAGGYVSVNKVEALNSIADHLDPDDVVCLMDTDIFLFGNLRADLFPTANALASNSVVRNRPFLDFGGEGQGIDLQKLLGALGCETPLKPGGVTLFLTGETVRNGKLIRDCFRFAQILYLMGRVVGLSDHHIWMSEMACFALALTVNGIDYELLDAPEFAVPEPEQKTLPQGSFFHYFADINDGAGGPFSGSQWHKQLFHDRDFLLEDIESFRAYAQGDLERRFLELAAAARQRLYGTPTT